VSWFRSTEGADPLRSDATTGPQEVRKATRSTQLATGTLACPECDAPVAPDRPLRPSDAIACPYCAHGGPVRDFLSLAAPTRPARVEVHVVQRLRLAPRRRPYAGG
jgi:hypothetical protein